MRRFCVALLFIVGLCFVGQSAMAADSKPLPYASLEKWVGQYPSVDQRTMKPYPAGQSFWDDPVVAKALASGLPLHIIQMMQTCWGEACAQKRISKADHFLIAHVCQRSQCTKNSVRIYLSLENGLAQACVQSNKNHLNTLGSFWYPSNFSQTKKREYIGYNVCDLSEGVGLVKKFGIYSVNQSAKTKSQSGGALRK